MLIRSLFDLGMADTKEELTCFAPALPSKGALMYTANKIFGGMVPVRDVKTIYAATNRTERLNMCVIHLDLSKRVDTDEMRKHEGRIAFDAWMGEGRLSLEGV